MTPNPTPITGQEVDIDVATPEGALAEFYRAFNGRDLVLMEQNWDPSDEASMDNPLGGIRRSWSQIRPTYAGLFGGGARVEVEFFDFTLHSLGEGFIAVGRERGALTHGDERLELAIRTSRTFRWAGVRYRQLHHHGSIDDADLLARYQSAAKAKG